MSSFSLRRSFVPRLDVLEDRLAPAVLTVNSLADNTTADATLSLRQAIDVVNGSLALSSLSPAEQGQISGTLGNNDTIQFALPAGLQTITLGGSELLISKSLTVTGPGANLLTVSGNNASRIFEIAGGATVSLSGLTVANGSIWIFGDAGAGLANEGTLTLSNCAVTNNRANGGESAWGGAITNSGTLTVQNCSITGNTDATTDGGGGGGLFNSGTATLVDSTVSDNVTGDGEGGGIDNEGGSLTVSGCTIAGNTSTDCGGLNNTGGTVTIDASTISGNSAGFDGGGITNFTSIPTAPSTMTISDSTIANNTAESGGGGIENYSGTLTIVSSTISGNSNTFDFRGGGILNQGTLDLTNTIVAGNSDVGGAPDLSGSLDSSDHNLIGNSAGGDGFDAASLLNVAPQLGPLQNNGGPTLTMALLPGSPAIDAGDTSAAASATDQRGYTRIVGAAIDIGAFEYGATAVASNLVLTFSAEPASGQAGQALGLIQVSVTEQGGHPVTGGSVALSVAGGPGGFAAGSTTAAPVQNGVATFSNLVLDTAGSYTLSASTGSGSGVTSSPISISPAAATRVAFVQIPTAGTAGQVLGSALATIEDQFGNVVSGYSGSVTVRVSSGPSTQLGGTLTQTIRAGSAVFGDLVLTTAGRYTLSAASAGLAGATSKTLSISPAAATRVVFTRVPPSGIDGQALGTVQAAIEDQYGNVVMGYRGSVTVGVHTGPSTTLGGTLTGAVQSGIASWSNLVLATAGSYTLSATSGALTAGISSAIVVNVLTNVSAMVQVTLGSLTRQQPLTYVQTVTIENVSGGPLTGPLALVLTSRPGGLTVSEPSGTIDGNPYFDFPATALPFQNGQTVTITLTFTAGNPRSIAYGTQVLQGI